MLSSFPIYLLEPALCFGLVQRVCGVMLLKNDDTQALFSFLAVGLGSRLLLSLSSFSLLMLERCCIGLIVTSIC